MRWRMVLYVPSELLQRFGAAFGFVSPGIGPISTGSRVVRVQFCAPSGPAAALPTSQSTHVLPPPPSTLFRPARTSLAVTRLLVARYTHSCACEHGTPNQYVRRGTGRHDNTQRISLLLFILQFFSLRLYIEVNEFCQVNL